MMTKVQEREAIKKYYDTYGRTPLEDGVKVIDIYTKQKAFLYGRTKEAVDAYKKSQNILRFILTFFMWPIVANVLLMFFGFKEGAKNNNMINGYFIFGCIFFVLYCGVFFGILCYRCQKAEKKHKGNVVWLNY